MNHSGQAGKFLYSAWKVMSALYYFVHKPQTPGSWFSSTIRSPVDLELHKQLVALELTGSRYRTAAWGRNKQAPWHSDCRGPPANISKHRANLFSFCSEKQMSQPVWSLVSMEQYWEAAESQRSETFLTASFLILSLFARDYIPGTDLILWSFSKSLLRLSLKVASSTFGAFGCVCGSGCEAK